MDEPRRQRQAGPTTAAFVVVTVLAVLAAVYLPLVVLFPWMWSGGPVGPAPSVLVTVLPSAVWFGWWRLVVAGDLTRPRRWTVAASAVATVAYTATWLLDAGSMRFWAPAWAFAAAAALAVAATAWTTVRR